MYTEELVNLNIIVKKDKYYNGIVLLLLLNKKIVHNVL